MRFFQHEHTYRVCYADTDQMGYMYYGNYARLYEIGRVEALRSLGFPYKKLEESGIMMPVYEMKTRYLKPARYDEVITIRTSIKQRPAARIVFYFELMNQEGVLLNTGEVTLVFVNMQTNRPVLAPAELLVRLQPSLSE
ncbi:MULTISPECIES: thioesterase family protein [unclassified Siphonobacter]|uniref:acyl-CoA thioesterase n=1 Tax=unclassified Siphonobacter TaxID=2635712 RepID=UPI000CB2A4C7|nr:MULTISPECIES: thioesterase family protein [unclassified Siphonobacter]MDQ1089357.1 acyl-CoA thioester hydrolase [Siphonobacter sp. SORGH_AS_1065]MDR6195530.1 acyl-CoA thioester hydrolase [Siphonobacter sp. SORGH_AS_0500]PKK35358.1 thioesterase [Siphonobacter sp. SORGH_AS_0500]